MSRRPVGLKQARPTNKRILLSGNRVSIAVLSNRLIQNNPFFHAQQDRHLMGFPTPSLFTPREHLIRRGWIYAVFPGKGLN